jgi:L-iditol 2-dehydrogenase
LLQKLPKPSLKGDDVLILVKAAGLCRMDVGIADGKIHAADDLILGHEFSGIVEKVGRNVSEIEEGSRVVVNPFIPCRACKGPSAIDCDRASFLGLDRHGAFAEFISVPVSSVRLIRQDIPFINAAFAEPLAAILAVLKTGISPQDKGLIYGDNRIARLTHKVLRAYDFVNIDLHDSDLKQGFLKENSYDFAIEAYIGDKTLDELVKAVKPRGKVILKTRYHHRVFFDLSSAIRKEIAFHCANYGSFDEAVTLIESGRINFTDLIGEQSPLEDFESVFKKAGKNESKKLFFSFENGSF